jgi:hypothetical protein
MPYCYLPMPNSSIALSNVNPAKAVEASAVAAPYELGYPPTLNFLRVYPFYFRGQAFPRSPGHASGTRVSEDTRQARTGLE